jgi:hypothetical protein
MCYHHVMMDGTGDALGVLEPLLFGVLDQLHDGAAAMQCMLLD